jgi:peptide/nickel transport system substrate-binding protein
MRSFSKLSIFLLLALSFILGCKTEQQNDQDLKTLYVRLSSDPDKLNPILYPQATPKHINYNIFLPLADYDAVSLAYEPIMMDELPTKELLGEEGCKFDIEISNEAKWPNGDPVLANDYLFTLKLALHPLTAAKKYRDVLSFISDVKIDSLNPKKLTVYFDKDYLISLELCTNFEILPQYIYDSTGILNNYSLEQLSNPEFIEKATNGDSTFIQVAETINSIEFSRNKVVGSGPYQLTEWIPQEAIILTKVNNYWGEKIDKTALMQGPDKIIFKIIPDDITALSELKSGLIDVLPSISSESYKQLLESEQASEFDFRAVYVMRQYFLTLNNQHPILRSKKVRQALAYCTNVEQYIDVIENGAGVRSTGFIIPNKKYYNENLPPIPFDIEKAQSLLSEDGWEDTNSNGVLDKVIDGEFTELKLPFHASGNLGSQIALLLKEDAAKAGIDIEIIKQSYAITKKNNLATGDYAIIAGAQGQSLAPDEPYSRYHSDNAVLGGTNQTLFKNDKADELIDVIRNNSDEDILRPSYASLQELLYEEQPRIYLYVPLERIALSAEIDGITSIKRPGYFVNTMHSATVPVSQ